MHHRRMSEGRMLLAALLVVLAGCGPRLRYTSAPLGNYDAYRPLAQVSGINSLDIELEREGYVAVLAVNADQNRREIPVVFAPWYPANEGERTLLAAGRHRVRNIPPPEMAPRACNTSEKPSLGGCRRPDWYYLPDVPKPAVRRRSPQNYIVIVAQSPIDPYELADDLYHRVREDSTLDRLLRAYDSQAAAPALQQGLLDRRGPVVLAGIYVTLQID